MKMKFRTAALLLAAAMAVPMVSCGDKKSSSNMNMSEYTTPTAAPTEPVVPVENGALLSIPDVTAAPGGVAEIKVHVENAEKEWSMCGLHITYPNFLKPRLIDEEKRIMDREIGAAAEFNEGFIGMAWFDNLPDELVKENKGCFFVTTVVGDNSINKGMNGDIATFYFEVPTDAKPGVYDLDFFYQDSDMFSNAERNPGYDLYAFQNWKGGKLTIT